MSVIRERGWGAGRMSDKVDREPANRAGTTLKKRLVNSTLPDIKGNFGEFFFERHISCPAFVV